MSWLQTAAAAFIADDLDGSEFFTWLYDLDVFDENPSWMELEVLAQYLDWDMADLVLFHLDPTPVPQPLTIVTVEVEK